MIWGVLLAHLSRGERHFAATRHVPWALNTPKMRCGRDPVANSFLIY